MCIGRKPRSGPLVPDDRQFSEQQWRVIPVKRPPVSGELEVQAAFSSEAIVADSFRILRQADTAQCVRPKAFPLALFQLGTEQIADLPSLPIRQDWVAITLLLELQLDDSVDNFAAVGSGGRPSTAR
jgi:hypothetical protein